MKNYKMRKTILGTSIFLLISGGLMNTVDAQWSVIDVNSTKILDGIQALNNNVGSVTKKQDLQGMQTDKYQEDTDKRARLAAGVADIAKNDIAQVPTIEQCIEMTNKSGAASSFGGSLGGGDSGPDGKPSPGGKKDIQTQAISDPANLKIIFKATAEAKACAGGMDAAVKGCDAAGVQPYAGNDVNFIAIKANVLNKDKDKDFANFSLNADGYKAAESYSTIATQYNLPPDLTADIKKLKENPEYVSLYKPLISKLNAAKDAIVEIANLRRVRPGATPTPFWVANSAKYKATFGLNPPTVPSFFEALHFEIFYSFMGPPAEVEIKDEIGLMKEISRKITVGNVVAINQLKATETTNILLAHLLAQAVTPTSIEKVKATAEVVKNISSK